MSSFTDDGLVCTWVQRYPFSMSILVDFMPKIDFLLSKRTGERIKQSFRSSSGIFSTNRPSSSFEQDGLKIIYSANLLVLAYKNGLKIETIVSEGTLTELEESFITLILV